MKNTIIITDPMQVKTGDKAYFHDCDFGFLVLDVDKSDELSTLKVDIPISETGFWSDSSLFDHAIRKIDEPEWPKPDDYRFHIYLGSDGKKYIYNPCSNADSEPWMIENSLAFQSTEQIYRDNMEALPLQELECVPKVSES